MSEIIRQNPGHLRALEPGEVKKRIHVTVLPVKSRDEAGKIEWVSPGNITKTVYMPDDEDEK